MNSWAAGSFAYNVGGIRPVLWHYSNGQWAQVEGPEDVGGLTALPKGDVWGIGDPGWLEHESRGTWTQVSSGTTDDLHAIAMSISTDGWAVGDWGTLLHYTRGSWRLLPQQTTNFLDQVAMVSPDEGWIVGDGGTLFHYMQGTWQMIHWSDELTLFSVSLLPADATGGWIVGADYSPQPRVWHKQGANWRQYQPLP